VTARTAPACLMTVIAWRLGGLTSTELWWHYVGLGGNLSRDELADYLGGTTAWPVLEHNVLSQTLDECLWDVGCPSLAPFREHAVDPHGVAPRTGRTPPDVS
jgi:hypothetical protein